MRSLKIMDDKSRIIRAVLERLMLPAKKHFSGSCSAFTLVEVLAAASILAVGMVIIYEIFLLSLDATGFTINRLNAETFVNEKIWQMQNNFDQQSGLLIPAENSGQIILNNRLFDWQANMQLLDSKHELFLLNVAVNWKDGNRERKFVRSTMIIKDFSNVYPKQK